MKNRKKGFTLIELLIVIAIIAILAAVAFVVLDPLTRFKDARDSARWSDINALVSAIKVNQIDNGGYYTWPITNAGVDTEYMISYATTTTGCNKTCDVTIASAGDCVNLQPLVTAGYLGALPVNPNGTGSWDSTYTGYYLIKNTNGTVTVGSCESENTDSISIIK